MSTTLSILLFDDQYGQKRGLLPLGKYLFSFLRERGHSLLNFDLYNSGSPSYVFENTLSLFKKSSLNIFILNKESLYLGVLLEKAIASKKKCLVYSENKSILNSLTGITSKPFYSVYYQTPEEIIINLKLNRL